MDCPPVAHLCVDLQPIRIAKSPFGVEQLKQRASAFPVRLFYSIADAAGCLQLLGGLAGYDSVSCHVRGDCLFHLALDLNAPRIEGNLGLSQLGTRLPAVSLVAVEHREREGKPRVPRGLARKADRLFLVLVCPARLNANSWKSP